jgi:hypothetical protein
MSLVGWQIARKGGFDEPAALVFIEWASVAAGI